MLVICSTLKLSLALNYSIHFLSLASTECFELKPMTPFGCYNVKLMTQFECFELKPITCLVCKSRKLFFFLYHPNEKVFPIIISVIRTKENLLLSIFSVNCICDWIHLSILTRKKVMVFFCLG